MTHTRCRNTVPPPILMIPMGRRREGVGGGVSAYQCQWTYMVGEPNTTTKIENYGDKDVSEGGMVTTTTTTPGECLREKFKI